MFSCCYSWCEKIISICGIFSRNNQTGIGYCRTTNSEAKSETQQIVDQENYHLQQSAL